METCLGTGKGRNGRENFRACKWSTGLESTILHGWGMQGQTPVTSWTGSSKSRPRANGEVGKYPDKLIASSWSFTGSSMEGDWCLWTTWRQSATQTQWKGLGFLELQLLLLEWELQLFLLLRIQSKKNSAFQKHVWSEWKWFRGLKKKSIALTEFARSSWQLTKAVIMKRRFRKGRMLYQSDLLQAS